MEKDKVKLVVVALLLIAVAPLLYKRVRAMYELATMELTAHERVMKLIESGCQRVYDGCNVITVYMGIESSASTTDMFCGERLPSEVVCESYLPQLTRF